MAQRAAFWVMLAAMALALLTLGSPSPAAGLGRPLAGALMLLGLVAMGGGEFVREDLRKPYVIGQYMFVNGLRLPDPAGVPAPPADFVKRFGRDRFTVDALNETGVLKASAWVRPVPDHLIAPGDYADRAEHEGRELFRTLCASCHTIDGYLAIRPLVRGKGADALDGIIARLASPADAAGTAAAWNALPLQVKTWRNRRMPPFVGTAEERRRWPRTSRCSAAPRRRRSARRPRRPVGRRRQDVLRRQLRRLPRAGRPRAVRREGAQPAELYEMIGRLPAINEMMPAFEGTDDERRALAEHLASLPGSARREVPGDPRHSPARSARAARARVAPVGAAAPDVLPAPHPDEPGAGRLHPRRDRARSRPRPDRPHDAPLAHLVVKAMPVLISATVTLGVAALLFLQVLYGRLFFVSAVVMGWWWLGVIGLLILAYYAAYLLALRE